MLIHANASASTCMVQDFEQDFIISTTYLQIRLNMVYNILYPMIKRVILGLPSQSAQPPSLNTAGSPGCGYRPMSSLFSVC